MLSFKALSWYLNCSDTTHRNVLLLDEVASQISVSEVDISVELVEHCLKDLGRNKGSSNHFVLAAAPSLANCCPSSWIHSCGDPKTL